MLTKCLAAEWAEYGIRVNAIAPGYVLTEMTQGYIQNNRESTDQWWKQGTPLRRYAQPQEMAGAAVFLASDASSYSTGSVLTVDGGYTAM